MNWSSSLDPHKGDVSGPRANRVARGARRVTSAFDALIDQAGGDRELGADCAHDPMDRGIGLLGPLFGGGGALLHFGELGLSRLQNRTQQLQVLVRLRGVRRQLIDVGFSLTQSGFGAFGARHGALELLHHGVRGVMRARHGLSGLLLQLADRLGGFGDQGKGGHGVV